MLSLSDDGINWDRAFWVVKDCPPLRFPGRAKGPGYQVGSNVERPLSCCAPCAHVLFTSTCPPLPYIKYPGALVMNNTLYMTYSINKEDIGISVAHL